MFRFANRFLIVIISLTPIYANGLGESGYCLEIVRNDEKFITVPVSLPQVFEISWLHSVEKEEWQEQFLIGTDMTINIDSTRFRTFGAGVPDFAPDTITRDGWVIMRGINRQVDPLVIRSSKETEHRLRIKNRTYPMPEGQYRLTVKNTCTKWYGRVTFKMEL